MARSLPEGLGAVRRHEASLPRRLLPLAVLLCLAGIGLSGVAGGGPPKRSVVENDRARIAAEAPRVLRSGEFFERRLHVQAIQAIDELSISFAAPLLKQQTINSMLPEPDGQHSLNGGYSMDYGRVEAGESLLVQIDLQTNADAFGVRHGDIVLRDGEVELARLPSQLMILP